MPRDIEVDELNDFAVLQSKVGHDEAGEPVLLPAVQIRCRWEEGVQQMRLPNAQTVALDASVVVAQDIPEGSLLWEGTLQRWNTTALQESGLDLMQVVTKSRVPDLKGRVRRRVLGLQRYKEQDS